MNLEVITLRDPAHGDEARILPGFGMNCFSYRVTRGGDPIEVLWSEPGLTRGEARPSGSGVPLLFPFPGRIRGNQFSFHGRTYSLEAGDGRGNAIHGFVLNRPWQVTEHLDARLTAVFQASRVDAAILEHWPADFRLTATYELAEGGLSCHLTVENPGDAALPCGFGAHPYFRLPLGGAGDAAACSVRAPVSRHWELVDMLPTGRAADDETTSRLRAGHALGDAVYDDVFSGLVFDDKQTAAATIDDPTHGRRLSLEFDDVFDACVVYTPPHREAICIEPYTCIPDPFWLTEQGVPCGLRVLGPGESFAMRFAIRVD